VHIAFVTSSELSQLTPDDRLAAEALRGRSAEVTAAVWTDKTVEWSAFDCIVVRSTWDYHRHAEEFRAWIRALEKAGAPVWNPVDVLQWNMEKTYLRELEDAGIPVVPTEWLSAGTTPDLGSLLGERGWDEAIIKPVISAGASRTSRVSHAGVADALPQLAESLALGDMMVQPFIREIQTHGEWSLMFFGGEFSHAVRKVPTGGDFRVQTRYGGGWTADSPDAAVVDAARRVLRAAPSPWLYARVDGIETASGFVLLELEMLEPSLFLESTPDAVARFVDAIIARSGKS
jgi:glutathione synthase/RimK-type ligase-like ATP-grasp enzyme